MLVAGPTTALAQQAGPTGDQYDPVPEQIEEAVASGEPVAAESDGADRVVSALPFTGLDIGLLAVAAVLLGISGFALQRLTRSSGGR